MSKNEPMTTAGNECLNVDFMRSLVKQYSELGQWTSAFFWADAAAAASGADGNPSGDDIWLLAGTMLSRGEPHRAAHTVVSRGLHNSHLLCLGVAMRAYLAAKEPAAALALLEECDSELLFIRTNDITHNRALASVYVTQARALSALERREAAAESLSDALRADCACYEALDLLLEQHAYAPKEENHLMESLQLSVLAGPERALVQAAYRERLRRHEPLQHGLGSSQDSPDTGGEQGDKVNQAVEEVRSRSLEGVCARARRLAASHRWECALKALDSAPWACPELRAACLLELRKSAELFAFAHELVDAYPNSWTAWFAVGLYYYLIGKSEFARRYLNKAKSLEPGAGAVWLAYGHSFAADNEHDQAMAAYFKASQLMPGCHLPLLHVGVECSLLNNISMAQRFLTKAALVHSKQSTPSTESPQLAWMGAAGACPLTAHEGAAAALQAGGAGGARAAAALATAALALLDHAHDHQLHPRWAATLDVLGHACRKLGKYEEALDWHNKALSIRPGKASTYAARGLCLALLKRSAEAADSLHAALARDPDDAVSLALLDSIVERLDSALSEEDIPQFPFPAVILPAPAVTPTPAPAPQRDVTNTSDMSMSFD